MESSSNVLLGFEKYCTHRSALSIMINMLSLDSLSFSAPALPCYSMYHTLISPQGNMLKSDKYHIQRLESVRIISRLAEKLMFKEYIWKSEAGKDDRWVYCWWW